jgi:hypothetical protein
MRLLLRHQSSAKRNLFNLLLPNTRVRGARGAVDEIILVALRVYMGARAVMARDISVCGDLEVYVEIMR